VSGDALTPLFSEAEIAREVESLAKTIAKRTPRPQIAVPILIGSFVFAADLMRALSRLGLSLDCECLWLRAYGKGREGGAVSVIADVGETVRGRTVLLIDGVLDRGTTLFKAKELVLEAGACGLLTAVAVDKSRDDALLTADYALFHGVSDFIVGYGMDDAGRHRGLPYIARLES
jgi:hypoxanthine phosphoribosyltransferase